ncbi:Trp biosynthesis-associated membrane protein [Microbacteriaceae bacterium 4G12]
MRSPARLGPARIKYTLVLAVIAVSALVLLAWSRDWYVFTLAGDSAERVAVPGSVAAPALSALALAGIALAAALAIAGPVFRVILGVLQIALGACIVLSASLAAADPVAAGARAVTDSTGIDGAASVAALVADVAGGTWAAVTLALGVLAALLGVAVLITSRRWPASSRRYSAVQFDEAPARGRDASVSDWDTLSDGRDPTGGDR